MLPIPTIRLSLALVVAAVITVFSPFAQPISTLVLAAIVLLVAAVDYLGCIDPYDIEIERELASAVTLGAEAQVRWRIKNSTDRDVQLAVADDLAPSLNASNRRTLLVIPARSSTLVTNTITPSRRGRFDISELSVRVFSPLGLVARQRTRSRPMILRVLPRYGSRRDAELRVVRAKQLDIGLRSAKGRGGGTEFDQLREYTPDDEFRRIDWAATARTGTTIARTYRAELNQTVINLLDNGRVMAGRVQDVPRVEHAMDAVMALTTVATGLGDKCGLMVFDREVRAIVQPSRSRGQLGSVTEAMYDLEPALAESDYRGGFSAALARFRRRTMIVVHTELIEEAVGQFLLPALPLISRHHIVVVAATSDPTVQRWAKTPAVEPHEVYRQVAALKAIDERRRTIVKLESKGAVVVDAPPGELAMKLVDAYLQVKATGRL